MPNWDFDEYRCTRCEAAERDAATRQAIADNRLAEIERLEAAVEHLREQNAMLMEERRYAGDGHTCYNACHCTTVAVWRAVGRAGDNR